MQTILSVELMRESDEKTIAAGTPGRVLMRRAGEGVFARLKYESGVHRVQRVPDTESGGRHCLRHREQRRGRLCDRPAP